MMNKGTYTNLSGKKINYTYDNALALSQKANFVMEVAGMIVSSTIGYAYILKEAIFNYCLIKYYTDIVLFENDDDFNLDMIDKFCHENMESVINVVKTTMGTEVYNELLKACEEAIEFRKAHFSDYKEEVSDLLQVVREFVVKPDYMNELLSALTDAVNVFSGRGDIDMTVINKLADIIPIMQGMGDKEVAKAIIEKHHSEEGEKPSAKRGRKPKTANKNVEIVK